MLRPIGIFDFLEDTDVLQDGDLCRGTLDDGKSTGPRIPIENVQWRYIPAEYIGRQCGDLTYFEFIRVVAGGVA